MIQFNPDEDLQDQVDNAREKNRTTLQRWFAYNQEHDDAQDILYGDFPQYFSWDRTQKPPVLCLDRTELDWSWIRPHRLPTGLRPAVDWMVGCWSSWSSKGYS
jgi:hypothetical protein